MYIVFGGITNEIDIFIGFAKSEIEATTIGEEWIKKHEPDEWVNDIIGKNHLKYFINYIDEGPIIEAVSIHFGNTDDLQITTDGKYIVVKNKYINIKNQSVYQIIKEIYNYKFKGEE